MSSYRDPWIGLKIFIRYKTAWFRELANLISFRKDWKQRLRRPVSAASSLKSIITTGPAKKGETSFLDAYEEGKKMSLEEAVAYALEES